MDLKKKFEETAVKKASEESVLFEKLMDDMLEKRFWDLWWGYRWDNPVDRTQDIIIGLSENGKFGFEIGKDLFYHEAIRDKLSEMGIENGKYSIYLGDHSKFLESLGRALQRFIKKNNIENELYLGIYCAVKGNYCPYLTGVISLSEREEPEGNFGNRRSKKIVVSKERCDIIDGL